MHPNRIWEPSTGAEPGVTNGMLLLRDKHKAEFYMWLCLPARTFSPHQPQACRDQCGKPDLGLALLASEGTLKALNIYYSIAPLGQGSWRSTWKTWETQFAMGNCQSALEKPVLVHWDVFGALGQGGQQVVNSVCRTNLITAIMAELVLRPN